MKRLILPLLLLLILLPLAGCDDDPVGPAGNAGVYSFRLNFRMDDAVLNAGNDVASVQYDVPQITPAVESEGAVLLYFREQNTWTAMPFTYGIESPDLAAVDHTITLGYGFDAGLIEVFYEASTGEIDLLQQPDREIKVVVIESLPLSKNSTLDLRNYEQVKAYYGLKD